MCHGRGDNESETPRDWAPWGATSQRKWALGWELLEEQENLMGWPRVHGKGKKGYLQCIAFWGFLSRSIDQNSRMWSEVVEGCGWKGGQAGFSKPCAEVFKFCGEWGRFERFSLEEGDDSAVGGNGALWQCPFYSAGGKKATEQFPPPLSSVAFSRWAEGKEQTLRPLDLELPWWQAEQQSLHFQLDLLAFCKTLLST